MARHLYSLVRKAPWLFTLLLLLQCFISFPYLIPADPDSAFFRSSVLSSLLIMLSAFPVHRALIHHDFRALRTGWLFGLLLAIALSLGSELYAYDRLLPGTGSMIRRVAVPLLASPALGVLASYAMVWRPAQKRHLNLPASAFFLILALCYLAVLLAFYPGVISYDFEHEIAQFRSGTFEAAHPVFHTFLIGLFSLLGEKVFHSLTCGLFLYNLFQLLCVAALFAHVCAFVSRRVPRICAVMLTAAFALLPFHGVLAVSTVKDALFTALCTVLCTCLWQMAEDPLAFLGSLWRHLRLFLLCLFMCLLRHNAVFAVLPAILVMLLLCLSHSRRIWLTALAMCILCFGIPKGLEFSVHARRLPSTELLSVPCQQLMRTGVRAELNDQEYEDIAKRFSFALHKYRENCADPAKGGNFDFARFSADPLNFWKTWAHYGRRFPLIYAEAFLENCIGIWYPGDTSHAHTLSTEDWKMVYLNTSYSYEEGRYDIHPHSLLPSLRSLIRSMTHDMVWEKIPLIFLLFIPSTYSFLLLLTHLRLRYLHRIHRMSCLPLWGLFLSILFSAGVFVRYAYPLMAGVPVLAVLAFFSPSLCTAQQPSEE